MATSTATETQFPPSSRPTQASLDGPHAVFLYPSGLPVVNIIDTIQVTYDTIWPAANLTLMCEVEPEKRVWSTAAFDLIGKDGSIDVVPTDAELELSEFPTRCRMSLKDAKDGSDVYNGGAFTLTSTQGAPSLYALSQTRLVTPTSTGSPQSNHPSPTADATGLDGMSTSNTMPGLGSESPSAGAGDSGDSIAAASGARGAGARAGIIIAVVVGVIALAVGLVFCVRNRRKGRTLLGRSGGDDAREKYVLDLPPAPVTGEDLVVPPSVSATTNRNSEDWRRFFGSATAAHSGK